MKNEMKKNLFMVAAVALMAMISCNKEEINNIGEPQEPQTPEVVEPSYYVEFTADLGADDAVSTPAQQSAATKTTYDATNKKTKWVDGDVIAVNGKKFEIKEVLNDGLSARFVNAEELGEDFNEPYSAVSPASAGTFESLIIPSSQNPSDSNVDPAALIGVAYSENNTLSFKHLTSLIKFQVYADCETVTITSDDALAGTVKVTYNAGLPEYEVINAEKTITVNGSFVAGQDYYVAVLPGEKTNFAVKIEGYELKSAAKVNIKRSTVANMGTLMNRVRLYVASEKTGFTMKIYAWGINGVTLPSPYPGQDLTWDAQTNKYYYDFPLAVKGKELNFLVNVNGDECKSANQKMTFSNFEETFELNWKWLYLKPNSNWKQASAKFAAYFFTKNVSGEYWQWMMKLDSNHYGCLIPGTYKNVIFCRMNSSATNMNWDNKWNQTGDLTIPTNGNNLFTQPSGNWDGATTSWSKKTF